MGQKRLNLVLPERTIDRIERVRLMTGASSATDTIKSALLTYEALVEFLADGSQFYLKRRDDENYSPVKFMFDVDPTADNRKVTSG